MPETTYQAVAVLMRPRKATWTETFSTSAEAIAYANALLWIPRIREFNVYRVHGTTRSRIATILPTA